MHHDDQKHDALRHYAMLKGLKAEKAMALTVVCCWLLRHSLFHVTAYLSGPLTNHEQSRRNPTQSGAPTFTCMWRHLPYNEGAGGRLFISCQGHTSSEETCSDTLMEMLLDILLC